MSLLIRLLGFGIVVAWSAVITAKLLNGRINLRGLLTVKGVSDQTTTSTARVQLLATTIVASVVYLQQVFSTGSLPDVPAEWIAVFAASHIAYMGSKAWSVLRKTLTQRS